MEKRIYYYDTDSAGVVYYANYLKYLEEARTEFLEERGISVKELAAQGTLFVVARQEIDYKSPAFYADILKINTRIADISAVKIGFAYEIKNQSGKIICTARTVMVCVGTDFKPKTIPRKIREAIER